MIAIIYSQFSSFFTYNGSYTSPGNEVFGHSFARRLAARPGSVGDAAHEEPILIEGRHCNAISMI
jgi:hypothetical protein